MPYRIFHLRSPGVFCYCLNRSCLDIATLLYHTAFRWHGMQTCVCRVVFSERGGGRLAAGDATCHWYDRAASKGLKGGGDRSTIQTVGIFCSYFPGAGVEACRSVVGTFGTQLYRSS